MVVLRRPGVPVRAVPWGMVASVKSVPRVSCQVPSGGAMMHRQGRSSQVPSQGGPLDLAGTAEIARLLGVSRQRVQQLTRTPGFPTPAATLGMGHVWHTADIRDWASETGRRLDGT